MNKTFTPHLATLLLGLAALPTQAQQLYSNGSYITGTTAKNGTAAPSGYTWSEAQNDNGNTTESNTSSGFSSVRNTTTATSNFELADDFTVPAGRRWTISSVDLFGYQTSYTGATSPFTEVYVRIWRGTPGATGSTIVYGDLTTNRFTGSVETMSYRIFNSLYPAPGSAIGTTRRIWRVTATLANPPTLDPGTYWLDWQTLNTGGTGHFMVPVTVVGSRTTPGANAMQFSTPTGTGVWTPLLDAGNPATAPDVNVEMTFNLNGTSVTSTRNGRNQLTALQAAPVPASTSVRMSYGALTQEAAVDVLDAQGRRVWQGTAPKGSSTLIIPIEQLAAGYYLVNMHSEQGTAHTRIMKQ